MINCLVYTYLILNVDNFIIFKGILIIFGLVIIVIIFIKVNKSFFIGKEVMITK